MYPRQAKNKRLEIDAAEIKRRLLEFLGDTVQRAEGRGRCYLPDRPVPIIPYKRPPPFVLTRGDRWQAVQVQRLLQSATRPPQTVG